MAASNALSGATAGVLTRIIDSAAIGASIGSAIPIVGTAAGYAVGKSISKIPGVKAIMKEGSLEVDHSSVQRWVVEYSPQLAKKFASHKKSVGKSWRMDETYIKVKGGWHYLYRAVEKVGQTIDFYLSKHRDAATAKRFFQKAIRSSGKPEKVNKDKSGSNTAALNNINRDYKPNFQIRIRQNKYLNNMIEQDYRFIKKKVNPMLWFIHSNLQEQLYVE